MSSPGSPSRMHRRPAQSEDTFRGKFAPMYGGCLIIWAIPYLLMGAVWLWFRLGQGL